MPNPSLAGMEVMIVVSDPWDFGTAHGTGPFAGKVLKVGRGEHVSGGQSILIQLNIPLDYQDVRCEFFVASPRSAMGSFDSLMEGEAVDCNLTRIPTDRATSTNPLDLSWWRGGVVLIGTLRPKGHSQKP